MILLAHLRSRLKEVRTRFLLDILVLFVLGCHQQKKIDMSIIYVNVATLNVTPGSEVIAQSLNFLSPTTRYYGLRSSFVGEGGKSRNFDFYPSHFGLGKVWAFWDGYVVGSWYIEFYQQYYGTFTFSDFYSEPSFIYPDIGPSVGYEDSEVSKVLDEDISPAFSYFIPSDLGFPLISQADLGNSNLGDCQPYFSYRAILKSKNRLFADCLKADSFAIQLYSTAKQAVNFEFIQIR